MGRVRYPIGIRFGRWVVLYKDEQRRGPRSNCYWICQCDCGTVKSVFYGNMKSGKSKGCGCLRHEICGIKHPSWKHGFSRTDRRNTSRYDKCPECGDAKRKSSAKCRKCANACRMSRPFFFNDSMYKSGRDHPYFGLRGRLHHNFVHGGVLVKRIRQLSEYVKWRNEVFERDNYTCKKCGVRGGALEAHHIVSFADILNRFLKKYSFLDPVDNLEQLAALACRYREFWNVNNGQTLCRECHARPGRLQSIKAKVA